MGGTEESYTLNFSRPGAHIIAQYFNLIHLGFKGYRNIMESCMANARLLSKALEATGWYVCVSEIHRKKGVFDLGDIKEALTGSADETSADYNAGLPVVAFRFSDEFKKDFPHIKQEAVSTLMRVKQYIIPSKFDLFWKSSTRLTRGFARLPITSKGRQDGDLADCYPRIHVDGSS